VCQRLAPERNTPGFGVVSALCERLAQRAEGRRRRRVPRDASPPTSVLLAESLSKNIPLKSRLFSTVHSNNFMWTSSDPNPTE
jgi:hypothetical protein